MKLALILLTALILALITGCQHGVVPISKRGVGGFDKPGTSYMHGRSPGRAPQPDLFVGNKTITVEPKVKDNTNGSLFAIDDQRNYLYQAQAPFAVGQFLDVKVVSVQTERKSDEAKTGGADADKEEKDESNGDAVVKELLESLPKLDPGPDGGSLVNNIKMKIAHVFENGDALAVVKRNSRNMQEGREVAARVRIPYTALISGKPITTKDLVDVHWTDTLDGELTERYSSGWQDEYSLRMSGFTEAKSLYAKQLEDKRTQLETVRGKVRNQLVSMGAERAKLAKERQEWFDLKSKADERVKELEDKIEEQNDKIEELTPEPEAPGEVRDGANGA